MSSNRNHEFFISLTGLASESLKTHSKLEQSRLGREARAADHDFSAKIRDILGNAKTIEDLIFLEQSLQKLDLLKAKTPQDKSSISASQKSYTQLSKTLAHMRSTPDSYFHMNMGHKDTGGDPEKIVTGNSLDFIAGNITRMQNRASFSPDSERDVWDARIAVARKTIDLFKNLHKTLAGDFEKKQK